MTFREYLATRRKTYDREGDFVLEALSDPNLADAQNWPGVERHLTSKFSSFDAVEAAKAVWRAYADADRKSSAGAT